jgi:folate-dependent tRNA-U54 methylase TrmFO/GidA
VRATEAHQTDGLAELVCSNSFRSDDADLNAVGLLHQEMRRLGGWASSAAVTARENPSRSTARAPPAGT